MFLKLPFFTASSNEGDEVWEQWSASCAPISRGCYPQQNESWCFTSSSLKILRGFNPSSHVLLTLLCCKTCFSFLSVPERESVCSPGADFSALLRTHFVGIALLGIAVERENLHPSHAQIHFTHAYTRITNSQIWDEDLWCGKSWDLKVFYQKTGNRNEKAIPSKV